MKKKYLAIGTDLQCEVKSIDAQFDYSDDMHNHDCYEILILLDGHIKMYTEYTGKDMNRGDVAFLPKYLFHTASLYNTDKYDRIVINVTENVLAEASDSSINLLSCFQSHNDYTIHSIHLNDSELEEIKAYAVHLQNNLHSSKPGSRILADSYLKLIMVNLTHKYINDPIMKYPNIMPPMVSKTFEYISTHLTEQITLETLEREIHHNGTYISRNVKKISGLSIQQYIIAKRIALACRLLQEGYSASEVCYMSGFNNYSNFSRTFSKQLGKSPKQLQMELRRK